MSSFERYSAYRDSGIKWLGEIPEHWEVKKLKFIMSQIQTGTTPSTNNKNFFDGNLNWFNPKDLNREFLVESENKLTQLALQRKEIKLFQKDSILIVGIGATTGKIAYLNINGTFNQQITGFHSNIHDNKFLFYAMKNFSNIFLKIANYTTLPILNNEFFNSFFILLSPKQEQIKIASFLDKKTKQLDQAIEQKEQLIELLKERRQILINDAVTKGLDRTVSFKDSGVEWIGEIPFDWKSSKLKFISRKIIDGTHFTPTYQDKGIVFLRVTDLHNKTIDLSQVRYISEIEHIELVKRCRPEKGDLLLSKNGTIGLTKIVDWDFDFSIFVSLCLIKIIHAIMIPELLEYQIKSDIFTQQLREAGKTTSVTNLHLEMIKDLLVLIPPKEIQQQIVNYIEKNNQKIDKAITLQQQQIIKLKEYKTTLIDSVVTGKVRVNDE